MKKIFFATCLFTLLGSQAIAQTTKSSDIGFSTGFSTYLGDLIASDITLSQPGWANGLYYRHNFGSRVSVKAIANLARLEASDHRDQTNRYRYKRNLSFRSDIVELGINGEINLLRYNTFNSDNQQGKMYYNLTPYVFAGVNYFHHNPKGWNGTEWVALQPLTTEGVSYSLNQLSIPVGLGVRCQASPRISLGVEMGLRVTFTDYLDDVSDKYPDMAALKASKGQLAVDMSYRGDTRNYNPNYTLPLTGAGRGNPKDNDWYTITQFSIGYRLGK